MAADDETAACELAVDRDVGGRVCGVLYSISGDRSGEVLGSA